MSEYCDVRTEFRNEEALIAALVEMGKWTPEMIERHPEAQTLIGVSGDERQQKAHVIVRREHVGHLANDLGFERQADGSHIAHISEWDRRHGFGDDWIKQVKGHYAFHVTRLQQEARGRRVTREWIPGTRKQLVTIEGYR